jgi:hypothetical protein
MTPNPQLISVLQSFAEHLEAKKLEDSRRSFGAKCDKNTRLQDKLCGKQEATGEILVFVENLLKMYTK